jgi:hypothetical protein
MKDSATPITVEKAVEFFIGAVPRIIERAREDGCDPESLSNADIEHLSAGSWLFLLNGRLPYTEEANIMKMSAAFELMWATILSRGGSPEEAREWLLLFGQCACALEPPMDRVEVIADAVRQRFYPEPDYAVRSPLEFMPHTLSAIMDDLEAFLTGSVLSLN